MPTIKHIRVLALGLLIALGILLFDFSNKIDPQDALDISFNKLEQEYQSDSLKLVSASSFMEIEKVVGQSNFNIVIKDRNDSLLYWNQSFAKRPLDFTTHWRKIFIVDTAQVEFSLDLFVGKQLDLTQVLPKEFLPRYEYIYSKAGNIVIPINGQLMRLAVSSSYLKSKWHNYLLLFWYISLLFISFVLSINYLEPGPQGLFAPDWRGWLLYSLCIILLYFGSGFLLVDYLFGAHSFSTFNGRQNLGIDLLSFASLLIMFYFLAEGLKGDFFQNKWHKVNPLVKYFAGSIVVNGMLFFAIYHAEWFIKSGDIFVNIEEILNIETRTILFLIIMLGYCMIYFYCQVYSSR